MQLKNVSEITKDNLGKVSLFAGCLGDYQGEGFANCVLAFPGVIGDRDISSTAGVDRGIPPVVSAVCVARIAIEGSGSLWLWVKDVYINGGLAMIPHKVVIGSTCSGQWVVRNEIAWKCQVADPAPENRLKRSYEKLFHLTTGMDYFYDRKMGLISSLASKRKNSPSLPKTGIAGKKYNKYINTSVQLTEAEKLAASEALAETTEQLRAGEISDYRMAIRGIHKVSGSRARVVAEKGFSIIKTKFHSWPGSDLWEAKKHVWSTGLLTNKEMPSGLVSIMVMLSCKPGGVVLDLFPSEATARAVIDAGRKYVAISTDEALLEKIGASCGIEGNSLFEKTSTEIEEHNTGEISKVEESEEIRIVQASQPVV
jgi:site-specific DNA-methyltransferase (adenine-specific)